MRALLKAKERRHFEIIEFLLDVKGWTTMSELAELFDSSTRILKADIAEIRDAHSQIHIQTGYLGIRIRKDNLTGIQSVYRKILSETLIFQILEEIFFDETLSVVDLSEKFFVSSSTIYRSISQINDFFKDSYSCTIEVNPCRFIGDEKNIRLFYRSYFSEQSSLLEWPFRDIDEESVNKIFDKILSVISTDMPIDFAYYEDIKRVVLVNKIRYEHGHKVDTTKEESELLNIFLNFYKYVLQPLGLANSIDISRESFYQIFGPYIRKDAAKILKQLNNLRKNLTIKDKLFNF